MNKPVKRECGSCTKCCEGWITGEALGYKFDLGKPCHFIAIGKGCTVYANRPKDPCINYKCGWLSNPDIPEWMKPDSANCIVSYKNDNGIIFMELTEAGQTLRSDVLSWTIQYALSNNINFVWTINGGANWIGSAEFNQLMQARLK